MHNTPTWGKSDHLCYRMNMYLKGQVKGKQTLMACMSLEFSESLNTERLAPCRNSIFWWNLRPTINVSSVSTKSESSASLEPSLGIFKLWQCMLRLGRSTPWWGIVRSLTIFSIDAASDVSISQWTWPSEFEENWFPPQFWTEANSTNTWLLLDLLAQLLSLAFS